MFENIDQKMKTLKKVLPLSIPAYEEKKNERRLTEKISKWGKEGLMPHTGFSVFFYTLKTNRIYLDVGFIDSFKDLPLEEHSVAEIAEKGNVSGNVNVSSST